MLLSFLSRFSACRSSLVRLLSVRKADCIVEAEVGQQCRV